ncbi:MAG TPA: imidazole glycerol phosphate synthase subunit HisF [Ornithinicoccus sp.]|nr:imidazole glycerol phosphate synthase subunit HisF [Ornithinicoccus sp.]
MTLARRIIACLDVRDGRVVKGTRFRDHQDMGGITDLAAHYSAEGADELVFYDITASPEGRSVDLSWIDRVARQIDIPFCVAGGISSVAQARAVLLAGADKISVNTPATRRPELVAELAREFGRQCVVVGVDSLQDEDGQWRIRQLTGSPDTTRALETTTLEWVERVQELGAGEIVLNAMGSDGVRQGYDVEQLRAVRQICGVPLIASGGAGSPRHFVDVFREADVDGALAAGVFHSGDLAIGDLKRVLHDAGVEVRLAEVAS